MNAAIDISENIATASLGAKSEVWIINPLCLLSLAGVWSFDL